MDGKPKRKKKLATDPRREPYAKKDEKKSAAAAEEKRWKPLITPEYFAMKTQKKFEKYFDLIISMVKEKFGENLLSSVYSQTEALTILELKKSEVDENPETKWLMHILMRGSPCFMRKLKSSKLMNELFEGFRLIRVVKKDMSEVQLLVTTEKNFENENPLNHEFKYLY